MCWGLSRYWEIHHLKYIGKRATLMGAYPHSFQVRCVVSVCRTEYLFISSLFLVFTGVWSRYNICVIFCSTAKWVSHPYPCIPWLGGISFLFKSAQNVHLFSESSPCYAAGPHQLPVLCLLIQGVYVSTPISQFLPPALYLPGVPVCVRDLPISISAYIIGSSVPFF